MLDERMCELRSSSPSLTNSQVKKSCLADVHSGSSSNSCSAKQNCAATDISPGKTASSTEANIAAAAGAESKEGSETNLFAPANSCSEAGSCANLPRTAEQLALTAEQLAANKAQEHRNDREARSLALEKAYVHDVYEQISATFSDSRYKPWPRVKQFLTDLEPGSFVCDVGCGSGKYLSVNPLLFNLGSDRCKALTEIAREKEQEVLICDNLSLPYKDESFDAVLSIAVIHHIATTERRVRAIRELARILRVGGKILISVWSMEQRHRKFESQDVLIPWHRPAPGSADPEDKPDTTTTTCTSEDDVTHYHAYTQTGSDSEPLSMSRLSMRRRGKSRHKGRSISNPGGRSSSDLSSPNESCYSFVRKALQKFSGTSKPAAGGTKIPWFFHNIESYYAKEFDELKGGGLVAGESGDSNENEDQPIEIRHLEEEMLLIPPLLPPRQTSLGYTQEDTLTKSRSLNDISGIEACDRRKLFELGRSVTCDDPTVTSIHQCTLGASREQEDAKKPTESTQSVQSAEGGSWFASTFLDRSGPKPSLGSLSSLSSAKSAISAFSIKSDSGILASLSKKGKQEEKSSRGWNSDSQLKKEEPAAAAAEKETKRAELTRSLAASLGTIQISRNLSIFKGGISAPPDKAERSKVMQTIEGKLMVAIKEVNENDESSSQSPGGNLEPALPTKQDKRPLLVKQKHSIQAFSFGDDKQASASNHYRELRRELNPNSTKPKQTPPTNVPPPNNRKPNKQSTKPCSKLPKQLSLNDEMFCEERKLEKKAIRDKIRRQQSLPSEHIESKRDGGGGLKETVSSDATSSRFDGLRERFAKFREASREAQGQSQDASPNKSFTHGLVKILHRWKSEHEPNKAQLQSSFTRKKGVNIDPIMVFGLRRDQSLDSATRRGLFHKKGAWSPKSPKVETHSPLENPCLLSPTVRRCCMECPEDTGVVERRLSRGEAGSDSSKDSSIQSDTSLDSEDSCISVIFVPHPELKSNNPENSKQSPQSQRSTSNSSESSESPTGRGSPMSPGSKLLSPSKLHAKGKISKLTSENNVEKCKSEDDKLPGIEESEEPSPPNCNKLRHTGLSMLPRIPEHRSFELEDLPIENPINCHPLGHAQRVEIMTDEDAPLSPRPQEDSDSRYNYPIVKHHPLFAKTHKNRSGISSLLLGESIEFRRKPGQSSCQGVQSVRKSTPKLLTFEIYNPETDDLDSDTSVSSSPDSEESVVSVISDSSRAIPKTQDILDEKMNEPRMETKEDDTIFKFDPEIVNESADDSKEEAQEKDKNTLYDKKEMERKSELRKKELINLLGENKNVFQNISSHNKSGDDIECVVLKTATQLQSMEELRIPRLKRSSECISPDIKECKSEPILYIPKNISEQDSLESISSLSEAKQDNEVKAAENQTPLEAKTSAAAAGDKAKVPDKQAKISTLVKMKQAGKKIDDDMMPEIVISDASENNVQTCEPEPTNDKELNNPSSLLDQQNEDKKCDTTAIESEKEKSISESPSPKSLEEKLCEPGSKGETEGQPIIPFRRLERKKRDDSLESNTPSVKSSIYHSDTGSVLSHRFSTISISSNLSSDVSFGNTSGVSGSSCYLASMSSADFDDRPPLASSFSLSEAEENEYLSSQPSQEDPSSKVPGGGQLEAAPLPPPVKKDQLSPPKTEQRTPKLKSLFKRSSDSKSRSTSHDSKKSLQSSGESRSRDGADGDSTTTGSKPGRSRIGSALTPDTSVEQTTCVERCSSSFEEELRRSFNQEDNEDQGSPTDSEDSAEAGGSLTHHRYYHVFREGEVDHMIEKYVENLHIISSYYDHANWCIVAEKVNVWTI